MNTPHKGLTADCECLPFTFPTTNTPHKSLTADCECLLFTFPTTTATTTFELVFPRPTNNSRETAESITQTQNYGVALTK